ncbi:ornithine decarboxylase, partial [Kipferlia bialata]
VRFIAEPGRFMVSASTSVATKIYARKGCNQGTDAEVQGLYVDDGVYGTFNNVVYDHYHAHPLRLNTLLGGEKGKMMPTSVFGPTCDGLDVMCSTEDTVFERCEVDEWLVWHDMGAYTHTGSYVFNGYTHVPHHYHFVEEE